MVIIVILYNKEKNPETMKYKFWAGGRVAVLTGVSH
jgi:hypothetical protein